MEILHWLKWIFEVFSVKTKAKETKVEEKEPQSGGVNGKQFAQEYYKLMLGALGMRERDVLGMFAYLAPALTGFGWLVWNLLNKDLNGVVFVLGCLVLGILLAGGRWHILTMAYNFRSVMAQCARIENTAGFKDFVLPTWRSRSNTPPSELLPEMFKAHTFVLGATMWVVLLSPLGLLYSYDVRICHGLYSLAGPVLAIMLEGGLLGIQKGLLDKVRKHYEQVSG